MQAAWYETQGAARDVLVVGTMPDPRLGPGEVRLRISASGINPGDLKKREDAFGLGMAYARVIPHSDGAGVIDEAGEGVERERIGQPRPAFPFWELLFKTALILLLGSDDFALQHELAAADDVNRMLAQGWDGLHIEKTFALADIAAAHAFAESRPRGRVVLEV